MYKNSVARWCINISKDIEDNNIDHGHINISRAKNHFYCI